MKSVLSASVLVLAVALAAPAVAGSGHLDVSYGGVDTVGNDVSRVQLGGAVATDVGSSGWNVQADAQFSRLEDGGSTLNYSEGGVHVFHLSDRFAGGGYFNIGDIQGGGFYGLGVEGKAFLDRVTFSGSIGFDAIEMFGSDADGWDASLGGKVFLTDNATLDAGFAYADVEDTDVTSWSVGGEFLPDGMPVSFFGEYAHHDADAGFLFVGDEADVWKIGLRWNFGGGSLMDRDRSGPTMNTGSRLFDSML